MLDKKREYREIIRESLIREGYVSKPSFEDKLKEIIDDSFEELPLRLKKKQERVVEDVNELSDKDIVEYEKCSKKEILSSVFNSIDNAKDSYDQLLNLASKKVEDFNKKFKDTDSWGKNENEFYIGMKTILDYAQIQKQFIEELYDDLENWGIPTSDIDLSSIATFDLGFLQSKFDTDVNRPNGRVAIGGNYPKLDETWFDASNVNLDVIDSYPNHFNTANNQNFKKELSDAIDNAQKKTGKAYKKCERGYKLLDDELIKRQYS